MLGSVIGVVGLITALLAAVHARRSAVAARASAEAAERSASAAERAVDLQASTLRDQWINRLSDALPDLGVVPGLIRTLPASLAPEWRQLIVVAWKRNSRMSAGHSEWFLDRLAAQLRDEMAHEDPTAE